MSDEVLSKIGVIARDLIKNQNRTFEKSLEKLDNEVENKGEGGITDEHNIQSGRGLSVSKSQDGQNEDNREIRNDASSLSQGESARTLVRSHEQESVEHSLATNSSGSGMMMEQLMKQMLIKNPAPDKKTNQMAWVGHMNSLKEQVEEIILTQLIYN